MVRCSDSVSSKATCARHRGHRSRAAGHPLDRYACSVLLPDDHSPMVSHDLGWKAHGADRPQETARRKMCWIGLEMRLVSSRRLFHCLGSVVRRRCRVRLDNKTVSEPSLSDTCLFSCRATSQDAPRYDLQLNEPRTVATFSMKRCVSL
jgi:hypothetical protein